LAATTTPEYELILMLDPEAPDERREQIVAEARSRIEGAGNLKHDTAWGMRKLAYEIRQRTEADYRFFRFKSDPPLLESLNHDLKIADGVLRFRIFKVDPRSPVLIPPAPGPTSPPRPRRPGQRRSEEPAEPEAAADEPVEPQAPAATAPPAEPEASADGASAGGEATGDQPEPS
jgi:small subunit ribosomal protein S6